MFFSFLSLSFVGSIWQFKLEGISHCLLSNLCPKHVQLWGQTQHCLGLFSCLVLKTQGLSQHKISGQPVPQFDHPKLLLIFSWKLPCQLVCAASPSSHHTPLCTGSTSAITFLQHCKAALRSLEAASSPDWTSCFPSASPHTAAAPANWAFLQPIRIHGSSRTKQR